MRKVGRVKRNKGNDRVIIITMFISHREAEQNTSQLTTVLFVLQPELALRVIYPKSPSDKYSDGVYRNNEFSSRNLVNTVIFSNSIADNRKFSQ